MWEPTSVEMVNVLLNVAMLMILGVGIGAVLLGRLRGLLSHSRTLEPPDEETLVRDEAERRAVEVEIARLKRDAARDAARAEQSKMEAERTRRQIQELRLQYLYRSAGYDPSGADRERFEAAMREERSEEQEEEEGFTEEEHH